MTSQADAILGELRAGEHITPLDALNRHHCMRLAAVIYDLRKRGYDIRTDIKEGPEGKHFTSYWLFEPDVDQLALPGVEL